jgi:hypothetical protein
VQPVLEQELAERWDSVEPELKEQDERKTVLPVLFLTSQEALQAEEEVQVGESRQEFEKVRADYRRRRVLR